MLLFVLDVGSRGRFFFFQTLSFSWRGERGGQRGHPPFFCECQAGPLFLSEVLFHLQPEVILLCAFFLGVFARFKYIGGQITISPLLGFERSSQHIMCFGESLSANSGVSPYNRKDCVRLCMHAKSNDPISSHTNHTPGDTIAWCRFH